MEGNSAWWAALAGGGCAGTAVDVCLFPLDTIKTRLQAKGGFMKAGGFSGIYRGIGAAAVASAPGAGVFFGAYDFMKSHLHKNYVDLPAPMVHMAAASFGEAMSAVIRVPFEVVKQLMQAKVYATNYEAALSLMSRKGLAGLGRSYVSLVSREIPFALLQYPLYEYFKSVAGRQADGSEGQAAAWKISACGSLAGGISAAITTPLDVAKTRVMTQTGKLTTLATLADIARTEGYGALFRGIVPRVTWISIGGAVFFGVYERSRTFFLQLGV